MGLMWGVGVVLVVASYLLVLLVCILSVNHSHSFVMISLYLIWVNYEQSDNLQRECPVTVIAVRYLCHVVLFYNCPTTCFRRYRLGEGYPSGIYSRGFIQLTTPPR